MEINDTNEVKNASSVLLLSIAHADGKIDSSELNIIQYIIAEFFNLEKSEANSIIQHGLNELKNSTDLFSYGKILNENFSKQDKIDFICCVFEVAYIDEELHFMEQHIINKIANILNVEHNELIKAKIEMGKFLLL